VNAASHTRTVLGEYKALGVPFPQAWASAMRTLPRKDADYQAWKVVLRWARPAYEAAYGATGYHVAHLDEHRSELLAGAAVEVPAAELLAPVA
jgi:hypothetical protein